MTQKSKSQSLDASSAVAQSEAFIIKHRNPIIIAAVVLVVLIGGFSRSKRSIGGRRARKLPRCWPRVRIISLPVISKRH